jgi:hypothetical protein
MIWSTGKNDLTRCITDWKAVFGSMIHSIFDVWHYKVLWTCALTRLLWYACNYVRLILYIMLHSTNLKPNCQMHFFARSQVRSDVHFWLHSTVHSQPAWPTLSRHSQVHSKYASKYSSKDFLKYTPRHALQDVPNCTQWHTPSLLDCTRPSKCSRRTQSYSRACSHVHSPFHVMAYSQPAWLYASKYALNTLSITLLSMLSSTLPIALDGTLPACLTTHSQVSSQHALNHTSEHVPKYTPNCTRCHAPSLLDYTLPSELWRHLQSHSRACSQVHSQLHSMAYS